MSYYRAGDYYRGDYYRAGGIFSSIGNVVGGVLKTAGRVSNLLPGGGLAGTLLTGAGGLLSSSPRAGANTTATLASVGGVSPRLTAAPPRGKKDEPGVAGVVHRLIPGGHSGYIASHRHMRYTNPKALKRAERRLRGFEKMAKRALRPLGLHVTRHVCSHKGRKR